MVRTAARVTAIAVGAALLALVTPHDSPWTPVWVSRALRTAGIEMGWLAWACWLLSSALTLALIRRSSSKLGELGLRRPLLIGTAVTLSITLIPGGPRAGAIVSVLLLGTFGVSLVVAGIGSAAADRAPRLVESWRGFAARISTRTLVLASAAVVLAGSAAASHFLLGRMPHVVDGAASLFHAKILLEGSAWAPLPQPLEPFRFTHMAAEDGRWYSQYPPGHLVLLAAGLLARAPWLVNPVLGAATAVLLSRLARKTHGERVARIAPVLWALSPFVWLSSMSFMSHAAACFLLTAFLLSFAHVLDGRRLAWAGLAGLSLGAAACTRPYTAALFAAPCGGWAVAHALDRIRAGDRNAARRLVTHGVVLIVALTLPLIGFAAFNAATTGSPFQLGYAAAHGEGALPGLGAAGWWGQPHTLRLGLLATADNLNALNRFLFGLAWPSLLLPIAGFIAGRGQAWNRCLASCVLFLTIGYAFYWYHDWTYGPRFLFEATPAVVLLTAYGLERLALAFEQGSAVVRRTSAAALAIIGASFLHAWIFNVPVLAAFYGRNYADGNAAAMQAASSAPSGSVVLVPGSYYPSVFPLNQPDLNGPVFYARDEGPESARRLLASFPARSFHRLRSLERYRLLPYDPRSDDGRVVWPVAAGMPFVLEALSFQVSHLRAERIAHRPTGELGGGWRNHDELRVASSSAGAEVGFTFEAERDERRLVRVAWSAGPAAGRVEVSWNGTVLGPPVDLWAPEPRALEARFDDVPVSAGRNGLLFRVVGTGERATGYELGLDWIALEPRPPSGTGRER